MRRQKFIDVADRYAARIRNGDYHLHELPAERELAVEAGVSYTTVRKAVQRLVDDGLLYRQPNGRAAVRPVEDGGKRTAPAQIALLTPAWESPSIAGWRWVLAQVCARFHAASRAVLYTHWDDPIIATTIQGFDGTFLVPEPETPPDALVQTLRTCSRPLVVLDTDWSASGIRSVRLNPNLCANRMLDHLASLGHRKIDYFNVQPGQSPFAVSWRLWLAAQHLDGELIDAPVEPYSDPLPAAYAVIDRLLREKRFTSKALFCATEPAAIGAMSAMLDHGLQPGHDVAVCTPDGGARTAFCNPSLTAMAEVDRAPYVTVCLEWMLEGAERKWPGRLLLQPDDGRVVVRHSTVPGGKRARRLC